MHKIGTKFKTRGKHPRECTVVDIYTTTNLAGEVVKTEYLCEHEFMGQKMKTLQIATTISMGLIK
jgi:hypothetical protein